MTTIDETTTIEAGTTRRRRPRTAARIAAASLALIVVVLMAASAVGWYRLRASLPVVDGTVALAGLTSPVTVERDALGVPTIRSDSRIDAARALGFLHAQERFFQMDLLRRQPAGELAEIFGPRALEIDRALRVHRFRARAWGTVAAAGPDQRALFDAYASGVNAGLAALRDKPWEYIVLRQEPRPWEPEDSLLVGYAMYLTLQDEDGSRESAYGLLRDTLPPELFGFLTSPGTEWDAPIDGSSVALPSIPDAAVFDLRREPRTEQTATADNGNVLTFDVAPIPLRDDAAWIGSNNFAAGGALTGDGRALLAGDMHLGISVPTIWYRTSIVYPSADGNERRVTGVTLPGMPLLVSGSNGDVAWAFTNSYGDWSDLVLLDESAGGTYRTAGGELRPQIFRETIRVKGEPDEVLEVEETIWGPIIGEDHQGRRRALRWVAHDRRGLNFNLLRLELAKTLEEAMDIANRAGIPAQNFVVADRDGQIGWTIIGAIPRRFGGYDPRVPQSWADGTIGWNGWLAPHEYPRLIQPAGDRIWTANARVVGGEMLETIGDGGYDIGARAGQIARNLREREPFTEMDLLAVQLDDRALFLERWQKLLLSVVSDDAVTADPKRAELRSVVEAWGGRASIDSAGYRMVRAFRTFLEEEVFESLTRRAREADEKFRWQEIGQREHVLWQLVAQRPLHLLDPKYPSWEEHLLAVADRTIDFFDDRGPLADRTWGERNTASFSHPLGGSIPLLGRFVSYPREPLPGDSNMPRVQSPNEGASQRMVVAPGREEEGLFHMPGGQSGHPLSPHFADGHASWAAGKPAAFLPGETVHTLRLVDASAAAVR